MPRARARMVIATVRGDVHDIGKNLVDIILTNNGYDVVNLGIKQPIADIIAAAEEHDADVIGMSGLLVKSTVVMKENLAELQSRGLAKRWPVILGGAALTRAYVEQDLAGQFDGEVRYAKRRLRGPGRSWSRWCRSPAAPTPQRWASRPEEADPQRRRRSSP